jgi:pyroglutamyl-peptidase
MNLLVTGFEPFGTHLANPSGDLAKAVDGRRVGGCLVRGVTLPVQHAEACAILAPLLEQTSPVAVVHFGLAAGRTRIGLERVALNVSDYPLPDAGGEVRRDEPCVPDGPAAYFSTLPLRVLLESLTADGIPAYVSSTAGTYLCNETMYWTLHTVAGWPAARRPRVGFVHLPLSAAMVAATGTDEPSMDFALMLRAADIVMTGVAAAGDRGAAG